jgi:predicted enzyme related to lactoylglutathione lyase
MSNLVVHFEIHGSEPERLADFYGRLLGWSFQQFGDMPYWSIDTGDEAARQGGVGHGINGGLTQRQGPRPEVSGPVNGANLVIAVDDVDGLYAQGLELGGSDALAPADMPGVGRLAYLHDPDGNVFGLISPVLSDGTTAMGS